MPAAADRQLIHCAAVFGPEDSQPSTGSGNAATFALRCLTPARDSEISIYRSAVYETRLVLADGRSERDFRPAAPLVVHVVDEGVRFTSWSLINASRGTVP